MRSIILVACALALAGCGKKPEPEAKPSGATPPPAGGTEAQPSGAGTAANAPEKKVWKNRDEVLRAIAGKKPDAVMQLFGRPARTTGQPESPNERGTFYYPQCVENKFTGRLDDAEIEFRGGQAGDVKIVAR